MLTIKASDVLDIQGISLTIDDCVVGQFTDTAWRICRLLVSNIEEYGMNAVYAQHKSWYGKRKVVAG
jgi:hypothetical protein